MFQNEVGTVQKSVWGQFSFYCLLIIVLVTILKKTISLSVTTFLLLTGVSYFLLGLMIGDLGWGFFSAHSKSLYLRTNWLLKLPFSVVSAVVGGRKGYSSPQPVAFAEMVTPQARQTVSRQTISDQGRPVGRELMQSVTPSSRVSSGAQAARADVERPERAGRSIETSLLAQASRETNHGMNQRRERDAYPPRHAQSMSNHQSASNHNSMNDNGMDGDADDQPSPLAMFDRPLSTSHLTPQGNGSEVAKVLAEHQPAPRRMMAAPQDEMILALKEAHGM